jgi:hypothetical protein
MDVYVFTIDGAEWEDLVVFTSLEEALDFSRKWPKIRVEIFSKTDKAGYRPSYNYYMNGELVVTH